MKSFITLAPGHWIERSEMNLKLHRLNNLIEDKGQNKVTFERGGGGGGPTHLFNGKNDRLIKSLLSKKTLLSPVSPPNKGIGAMIRTFAFKVSHKRTHFLKSVSWFNIYSRN